MFSGVFGSFRVSRSRGYTSPQDGLRRIAKESRDFPSEGRKPVILGVSPICITQLENGGCLGMTREGACGFVLPVKRPAEVTRSLQIPRE